jgi:excisionase family DNA binding protein
MEDRLFTIDEAAERLRVSRRTIREWLRVGTLRGVKVGERWRVQESVIESFIREPHHATCAPEPDPLADVNDAIAEEGLCTRPSEQDQLTREAEGRDFYPPLPPE